MIWFDRYRRENGKVIRPNAEWFEKAGEQTRRAIEEGPEHKVTGLYRNVEVKKALEKLFFDKCVYCETSILTSEWDVEHYRPKGRVAERPDDHPGYYWLAYTWENLYPACKFCNQRRKDYPRYDDPVTLPSQGKLDQFPIKNENQRALSSADDVSQEIPFLLDPTNKNDDPETHFTYDIRGQIHPLQDDDRFAAETIRICHLKRRRLREARAKIIVRTSELIKVIIQAREVNNTEVEQSLNQMLDDFTASKSEYAGAARCVRKAPEAFMS